MDPENIEAILSTRFEGKFPRLALFAEQCPICNLLKIFISGLEI